VSADIDGISQQLSSLPQEHPAKIIGAVAVNGMWFIRYVAENDPHLYRRARDFAIDCTKINGVRVFDANGITKIESEEGEAPPYEEWQ
jgi:hypothetical protein